jgi:hypothetical protein
VEEGYGTPPLSESRRGSRQQNKKIYGTIEAWRNQPIEGEYPLSVTVLRGIELNGA